ncbi:glycosyltransferase [Pseudomonadota bacterium]
MAMTRCAIVLLSFEQAKGLLASLESIVDQNGSELTEIIIAAEPGTRIESRHLRILEQSPWISNWKMLTTSESGLLRAVLEVSSADYFVFLNAGDILYPNAVRLLSDAVLNGKNKLSLGAARWTNGRLSWSHDTVDELFREHEAIDFDLHLPLQSLHPSATAIIHRSLLVKPDTDNRVSATVVHEYVSRRWCSGETCDGNTYSNRNIEILERRTTHAIPFPAQRKPAPVFSKNVWLFGERGGEAAEDNSLAFFLYCIENVADIECYYVLNAGANCPELRGNEDKLIYKGSDTWTKKIHQASHFFFTDSAADILSAATDISLFPDVTCVYLTHGCLAYSPGVYQKSHQYIDYVTCTNRQDIESASSAWGFPTGKFLLTGLARWDRLSRAAGKKREILLCPTWRKSFNSDNWNRHGDTRKGDLNDFQDSDFFVFFKSFLQSPDLLSLLVRNNLHITVNLHFRFRKFLSVFEELHTDRIRIATQENDSRSLRVMMEDAVALITDYSSIMWDMGFMEKPVICYQFDKPMMLAERGKDQFSVTDDKLFAKVCYSENSLLESLDELVSRSFCLNDFEKNKLNKYIPRRDSNNCERIYRAITALRDPVTGEFAPIHSRNSGPFGSSEQIEKVLEDLSSAAKVGIISSTDLSSYTNTVELEPDTWREVVKSTTLDAVVIVPHLNARDAWAHVFFDPPSTVAFLSELVSLCESKQIRTILCQSPIFFFDDSLEAEFRRFNEVVPTKEYDLNTNQFDVSVIIPAFNSENYLSNTIDSVLDQRFVGKIEIIIVNDGSTDSTQDVIDRYTTDHPNIVSIEQRNYRQGMARNNALLQARGENIMFLDSDDILPVNAVAELHHVLKFNETKIAAGLVVSRSSSGSDQRINQAYYHYTKAPRIITAASWPHVFYDPSCAGKMYQREFLLDSKLFFPQSYHEDQVFTFKLFSSLERVAVTKSVVYLYVARDSTDEKSGTQTFTNKKLREMLLAGILAKSIVGKSGLSISKVEYALGFLVMRYDRFLWKQNSTHEWKTDKAGYDEVIGLLERFLRNLPDELIWKSAKYNAVFLLLVKRSMHDLANRLRVDEHAENLYQMIQDGSLPNDVGRSLVLAPELVSKYDYYKAVPIGNLGENTHIVTEMSYGYRLGHIFVDVAKKPWKVLLMPFRLILLTYDMVTRKGRTKEKTQKEVFLQSSPQALVNHSEFIKSTASFRLGVAIMEAFTSSPKAVLRLPAKIRGIYEQTR